MDVRVVAVLAACAIVVGGQIWDNDNCTVGGCDPECWYHGRCVYHDACKCNWGWEGDNCNVRWECAEADCGYGACCGSGERCCCNKGWSGDDCRQFTGIAPYDLPACTIDGVCTDPDVAVDLAFASSEEFSPYIEYKEFGGCDCAIGACIGGAGVRRLLRFSIAIVNKGSADLFIGAPGDHPDRYEWDRCRRQMHLKHWLQFKLYNGDGRLVRMNHDGSTVVDATRRNQAAYGHRKYTPSLQGLQRGWADEYPSYTECQWLDVTDLELGEYDLEIEVNWRRDVAESNYTNNAVRIPMRCESQCLHGSCNFGLGCICDEGWRGDRCHIRQADSSCRPQCRGKSCGEDGCGGVCGECERHEHCDAETGACFCTPQCGHKECGSDGCGGNCGECLRENETCWHDRCDCIPSCVGKEEGDFDGCDHVC